MKKILCIIIAAMMIASVSVNAVEVDEEVNDVEVVETVEDMPDEDVAEVADVDKPEDTPDEAPADLEDLPDLEDPVIDEPEDYPDADPDDEIAPVVLAATGDKSGYAGPSFLGADYGNVYYEYTAATKTLRFYVGAQKGSSRNGDGIIGDYYSSNWEKLDIECIKFDEGIIRVKALTFNKLKGDIVIDWPKSLVTVDATAFGTLYNGFFGENVLHGIINYHGDSDDWDKINIGNDNKGIDLTTTWNFQMYIPDSIELTNVNNQFSKTITTYKASSIVNIDTDIYFDTTAKWDNEKYPLAENESATDIGRCSNVINMVSGSENICEFEVHHWDQENTDGTKIGKCTISIAKNDDGEYNYTPDYQDYSCSAVLTFNFDIS